MQAFHPYLTGAVWKGIVAEHAPIHLQLFTDNPKELEIQLLDDGRRLRRCRRSPHFAGGAEVEALAFYLDDAPVLLSVYQLGRPARRAPRKRAGGPSAATGSALERLVEPAR